MSEKPNIVIVMTDQQRADLSRETPETTGRHIGDSPLSTDHRCSPDQLVPDAAVCISSRVGEVK